MIIEVGKYYRTRAGQIVGPIENSEDGSSRPYRAMSPNNSGIYWWWTEKGKGSDDTDASSTDLVAEVTSVISETTKETTMRSKLESKAREIREIIRPYDNYILAAAALVVLDHFVFKGKYRDKFLELAKRLADKCAAIIDNLINKIGG